MATKKDSSRSPKCPGKPREELSKRIAARLGATIELGRRIRAARDAAGLNQTAAAAKIGIGQPHLSDLERGIEIPSIQTLAEIASVFGVEIGDLLPPTKLWKDYRPLSPEESAAEAARKKGMKKPPGKSAKKSPGGAAAKKAAT